MLPTPTPFPEGNTDVPQLNVDGMQVDIAYSLVSGYNRINDSTHAFDILFFFVIVFLFVFLFYAIRTALQRWNSK